MDKILPENKLRKSTSNLVRISEKHIELSRKYRRTGSYRSSASFIEKAIEEKNYREKNFKF